MITSTGINATANFIFDLISHGNCVIDGVNKTVTIYDKKVVDNTINVIISLDDTFQGDITKFELIDKNGNVFASQPDSINKTSTKLLLVTFKFVINEVV